MNQQEIWKTFMAAVCTLMLGTALPAGAQMQSSPSQDQAEVSGFSLDAEILGKNIDARDAQNIAQIEDVIFGNHGKISQYLVSLGEGAGEKTVALNPDQLQFSEQGDVLFNGNSSDLENLPEVNPYDFGAYRGYYGSYPGPYDPYAHRPYYGPGPYFNPYRDRYMGGSSQPGSPASGYYQQGPSRGYQENMGRQQGGSGQGPQAYQQPFSDQGCMDQRQTMGWGFRQGWMKEYAGRGISGDTFVSANLYDPQQRMIGEVTDIILDPQNDRVTHAVVGLGDKQVLVPFNRLRYVGPSTVVFRGTESQLEQMPEFQESEDQMTGIYQPQPEQKAGAQMQPGPGQPQFQGQQGQTQQ